MADVYRVNCPVCGKPLTPEANDEDCPNSPYLHGKHPIFVLSARRRASAAKGSKYIKAAPTARDRAKALPPPDNALFDTCFRIQREACEAAGQADSRPSRYASK